MINITQEEIIHDWSIDDEVNPLVSIRCITYNHEPYIAQALDSFLMQKTSFSFEVIVHDDASTDKTAEIIHEYEIKFPKIIKPIYEKENLYSKHDGSLTKIVDAACKGKYLAFCEGDDYWIDPHKLQKQYDLLKRYKSCGFCYSYSKVFIEETKRFRLGRNGRPFKSYEDLFVNGNKIPTQTIFMESKLYFLYKQDYKPNEQSWSIGDLPMFLWFAKNNKIKFLPEVTAVYRVLRESASHSSDIKKIEKYRQSCNNIRQFLAEKYNEYDLMNKYNTVIAFYSAYRNNDRKEVIKIGKELPSVSKTFKNNIILLAAKTKYTFYILRKLYR